MTQFVDPFDPEQTIEAINASLAARYDMPLRQGGSREEKEARWRDMILKDGDFQMNRVRQWYFAPYGMHQYPLTEAENNTIALRNAVRSMPDSLVQKFERIAQSYPNQSPGFYAALVQNPEFDVDHPEFENLASIDLEENDRQITRMSSRSSQFVEQAAKTFADQPYTPFNPTSFARSGGGGIASISAEADATALPPGYENPYGTGSAQGALETVNDTASGVMGAIDRFASGATWLDPVRDVARTLFALAISPQQAVVGAARTTMGAVNDQNLSLPERYVKGAVGAMSWNPLFALAGNAAYGDDNFIDAWEQTLGGQWLMGKFDPNLSEDTGEGWFPAGEVAKQQASAVWQAHTLDDQVWSFGVQTSHALGMDPASSAYHAVSGTIDAVAAVLLDPLVIGGKFAIPSKTLAAAGRGVATKLPEGAAARVTDLTLRGGARRAAKQADLRRIKQLEAITRRAAERGATPEAIRRVELLADTANRLRNGDESALTDSLVMDARTSGMTAAARKYVADVDQQVAAQGGTVPNVGAAEAQKINAVAAANNIDVQKITGLDAEDAAAWELMLKNDALIQRFDNEATRQAQSAASLRRESYEAAFVDGYTYQAGVAVDLGEQQAIGDLLLAPDEALSATRAAVSDLQEALGQEPTPALVSALDEAMTAESPYGSMPLSTFTYTEPGQSGYALGNFNGEQVVVRFGDMTRVSVADDVVERAQTLLDEAVPQQPEGVALSATIPTDIRASLTYNYQYWYSRGLNPEYAIVFPRDTAFAQLAASGRLPYLMQANGIEAWRADVTGTLDDGNIVGRGDPEFMRVRMAQLADALGDTPDGVLARKALGEIDQYENVRSQILSEIAPNEYPLPEGAAPAAVPAAPIDPARFDEVNTELLRRMNVDTDALMGGTKSVTEPAPMIEMITLTRAQRNIIQENLPEGLVQRAGVDTTKKFEAGIPDPDALWNEIESVLEQIRKLPGNERAAKGGTMKALMRVQDQMEAAGYKPAADRAKTVKVPGRLAPLDQSKPINLQAIQALLYDEKGVMRTGADLTSGLLRLLNQEPTYTRNLVLAAAPVADEIALSAKPILLNAATKMQKSLRSKIDKQVRGKMKQVPIDAPTLRAMNDNLAALTDFISMVKGAFDAAEKSGQALKYGELLALAGQVGAQGLLARLLKENGVAGVKGLTDDGLGVWWADRSNMQAAVALDDGTFAPMAHRDPSYFLIEKDGAQITAKTFAEANRAQLSSMWEGFSRYLGQVRAGSLAARSARVGLEARKQAQQALQYNAARAIGGLDSAQLVASEQLMNDVADFLDSTGALPSGQTLDMITERLLAESDAVGEVVKPLKDTLRSNAGIYTDVVDGSRPLWDTTVSLEKAKFLLNLDSKMHPLLRKAIKRLATTRDMKFLMQATKFKWDIAAYKEAIDNAHRTKIELPDGKVVPYTDEMREADFIKIVATQMGADLNSSIRGVRTVIEPGDGPKFGRTVRKYSGQKLDRWSSFAPNRREVDLSNHTEVARRIVDYAEFHRIDNGKANGSLAILMGEGNPQQRARLALEDILNKVNDVIVEQEFSGFDRAQMEALRGEVRRITSYSFARSDERAKTYVEQVALNGEDLVTITLPDGTTQKVALPLNIYLNEQIGNFLSVPSTLELVGMRRKIKAWRSMIAKAGTADSGPLNVFQAAMKTADYLYSDLYRSMLLLRPAYIVRNYLEMEIRSFLSNSPVSYFQHPVTAMYTAIGMVSPSAEIARSRLGSKMHPAMLKLKESIGEYDMTVMGRDMGDYGDTIADSATRMQYMIERGIHSLHDERTAISSFTRTDHLYPVTHPRWTEGYAGELFSLRVDAIARMVARRGFSDRQLEWLNFHLQRKGEPPLVVGSSMDERMRPVALFMHEALNDPNGLKRSLEAWHEQFATPDSPSPFVDGISRDTIDQVSLYMDKVRSGAPANPDGSPNSAQLIFSSPDNIRSAMLMSDAGYVKRVQQMTMNGEQQLLDYIAYGRYADDGLPLSKSEKVVLLSSADSKAEMKAVRGAVNNLFGDRIAEARGVFEGKTPGVPVEGVSDVANILADVRVFVSDPNKSRVPLIDNTLDTFFGFSSRVERLGKMGPEYRAEYWRVLGESVDDLSTATLALSETAAQRTLSPLRRLTEGKPGPSIGRSHAFFRGVQKRKAQIDEYNLALAKRAEAKENGTTVPDEVSETIKKYESDGIDHEVAHSLADTAAYDHVTDLFYDASRRRNIWHSLRYASMFINAAMNTLSVWGKLLAENPIQLYKGYRFAYALQSEGTGDVMYGPEQGWTEEEKAVQLNSPNRAFLFKDATGWKVNVPLAGTLLAAALPGVTKEMTTGALPVQFRVENLNLAMSGGSILPGISPLVTIPYSSFRKDTSNAVEKFLDNWFLPYGEKPLFETALPAWIVKLGAGFSGSVGLPTLGINDDLLLTNLRPAMSILYASGRYPNAMTDPAQSASLLEDAQTLAAQMTTFQAIGQAILPSAPLVEWAANDKSGNTVGIAMLSSLFYDQYLPEYKNDYERALVEFYDDYGMTGIFATTGARDNLGKIPSSQGWDFIVANPDLAKSFDQYIYYFFPTDEPDMTARRWLEDRDLRTYLTPPEQINAVKRNLMRTRKAIVNQKYASGLITEDDANFEKKQIEREFGDIEDFAQKEAATPDKFPIKLDQMLQHPEFSSLPAGIAAGYAMSWRKYYVDKAEETGYSLGAQRNADLRNEYYSRLDAILNQTGGYSGSPATLIIDMLKKEF